MQETDCKHRIYANRLIIRDHAGALAIQEAGMVMVQGIAGDYFCVVGFPMSRFYQELVNIVPLMA